MKRIIKTALFAGMVFGTSQNLVASSHREAPAISRDPEVDITDLYAFKSPDDASKVNLIMNVSPAYNAYAGPNWYGFADDAIYEIHIDTSGDGVEDITYQFRFKTADYKSTEGLIIANFPAITYANGRFSGSLNQTYSVTRIDGKRRTGKKSSVASELAVAPPRIGPATTDGGLANADDPAAMYSAYKALSDNAIKSVGAAKFFAGPRNDPFFVDLGGVFDRVSVRIPGITGTPKDSLAGTNVLTIAMQVPRSELLKSGEAHFGVWATTSRPQSKVLRTGGKDAKEGGGWVQVSRLGNPLVNEVVIKMKDKDKFNNTEPKDDAANYAGYVVKPQLAYVLNVLYSGSGGLTAPNFIQPIAEDNRTDLVTAFVDGIKDINKNPKAKANAGDMIRVNLDFPVQEWPFSGRQLKDDVVKIALVFLAQCNKFSGNAARGADGQPLDNPFGNKDYGMTTKNCALDDFITADDVTPGGSGHLATFPYVDLPFSAYGRKN